MENNFLLKEKFRPGSMYHLVEWNQLNPEERKTLTGLYDEVDVYGIFQPAFTSPALTAKVAYREVALLYLHLQQSDLLPRYLIASGEQRLHETIVQLVLDSILEIEFNGDFVSGPAAVKAIFGNGFFESSVIPDRLSKLSMEGIQYAWTLRNPDARSIANKLYSFNTTPWDASARSDFYATYTVKKFLFPDSDISLNQLLNEQWNFLNANGKKAWLSWIRPTVNQSLSTQPGDFNFKLYISPIIKDLPEVFRLTVPIISSSPAFSFKVGGELPGLLRPDKMVVYFENKEALKETAAILEKELAGYSAQGVPFTSQLDKTGLLSWGSDPPESDVLTLIEGGSWRTKVTDQLALAIIRAKADRLDRQQAIHFIQAKLSAAGINTVDWTPMNQSN